MTTTPPARTRGVTFSREITLGHLLTAAAVLLTMLGTVWQFSGELAEINSANREQDRALEQMRDAQETDRKQARLELEKLGQQLKEAFAQTLAAEFRTLRAEFSGQDQARQLQIQSLREMVEAQRVASQQADQMNGFLREIAASLQVLVRQADEARRQ